jgi:murein L,D-transpeptidase YcbB/YkuD
VWYKIQYAYSEAKKLCELTSVLTAFENIPEQYQDVLKQGDTGPAVALVQYFLALASQYMPEINPISVTGNFDDDTAAAVAAFGRMRELENEGIVDEKTYNDLVDVYMGLLHAPNVTLFCSSARPFPKIPLFLGIQDENVAYMKDCLNCIADTYTAVPAVTDDDFFDKDMRGAVMTYQKLFGLPVNDIVDLATWDSIGTLYDDLRAGLYVIDGQYPGYVIDEWLNAGGEGT